MELTHTAGTPVQGSHPVLEDLGGRWMPEPLHSSVATTAASPTDGNA